MINDNPAKRLLDILNEGLEEEKSYNCSSVWESLLDIEETDGTAVLISRLGKVMQLPELIIQELKKLNDTETSDYEYWETKVSNAFNQQNLAGNWETFINHIDQHTITYLKMSKLLLSGQASYQELSEDKLAELRETILELMQEVRESNLEQNIQSYLLAALGNIHLSIIEYKITGYIPILKNIDATIGHAVTNPHFKDGINESDIGKKVWGTLQGLSTIITIATGVTQLPAAKNAIVNLLTKL